MSETRPSRWSALVGWCFCLCLLAFAAWALMKAPEPREVALAFWTGLAIGSSAMLAARAFPVMHDSALGSVIGATVALLVPLMLLPLFWFAGYIFGLSYAVVFAIALSPSKTERDVGVQRDVSGGVR